MIIIGVDYHPSDPYIAFADTETGECGERRLNHSGGEAEKFYRDLQHRAASVRVGRVFTGYSRWFERLRSQRDERSREPFKVRHREGEAGGPPMPCRQIIKNRPPADRPIYCQVLVNAVTGDVAIRQFSMSDNATYQDLGRATGRSTVARCTDLFD
jgi:hypothetical protein